MPIYTKVILTNKRYMHTPHRQHLTIPIQN